MAGAVAVLDLAVVARALVGVVDVQRDRRAGGEALEGAGKDADLVGFLALGDMAAGAWAAAKTSNGCWP
jgi:hypothetical protein